MWSSFGLRAFHHFLNSFLWWLARHSFVFSWNSLWQIRRRCTTSSLKYQRCWKKGRSSTVIACLMNNMWVVTQIIIKLHVFRKHFMGSPISANRKLKWMHETKKSVASILKIWHKRIEILLIIMRYCLVSHFNKSDGQQSKASHSVCKFLSSLSWCSGVPTLRFSWPCPPSRKGFQSICVGLPSM